MKKIISVLLFLSINLLAIDSRSLSDAGFDDLTTQQKAEMLKMVADKKDEAVATAAMPVEATVDKAQKWVDLGASIGKGLASSAKELGVAVNDFAKSDVGKLTMYIIVFKIAGGVIIHMAGGLIFMTAGFIFVTIMLNRYNGMEILYHENGKVKSKTRNRINGDTTSGFIIAYFGVALIGIIIIFTY